MANICRGKLNLFIENLNFKYGLMLWEERFDIVNQIKNEGSAKLLIDTGFGCECGSHAKFPYELISRKTLKKQNWTIQFISRYESGPKAIFRITEIRSIVKGHRTPGQKRFLELTLIKPLKIRKKSKKT
tara:strand:- start:13 stop:399 length:387 start_codon:yes stop_codon:yes gene_type:complete